MMTALPKCWQLGPIMASQQEKWCQKIASFPVQIIFWNEITIMVRLSKILMFAEIIHLVPRTILKTAFSPSSYSGKTRWGQGSRNNINATWHEVKRIMIFENLETIYLFQRNVILKMLFGRYQQIKVHCVQAFETTFLWSSNYFSTIFWSCSNILPLEPKLQRF